MWWVEHEASLRESSFIICSLDISVPVVTGDLVDLVKIALMRYAGAEKKGCQNPAPPKLPPPNHTFINMDPPTPQIKRFISAVKPC